MGCCLQIRQCYRTRLEQKLEAKQIQTIQWLYRTIFILDASTFGQSEADAAEAHDDYYHEQFGVKWLYQKDTNTVFGKKFWYYIERCDSEIEHDRSIREMRSRAKKLINRINRSKMRDKLIDAFEAFNGEYFDPNSGKYFMSKESFAIRKLVLLDKIDYLPKFSSKEELLQAAGLA